MNFNQNVKMIFLIAATVNCIFTYTAKADVGFQFQRPQIPEGKDVLEMPQMSMIGSQVRSNCYAEYLIEKVGRAESRGDGEAFFQVRVTNIGECPLNDISIKDFFPENVRLLAAFPRPEFFNFNEAVWHVRWLDVGQTAAVDLEFEGGNFGRWVTNNACAFTPMIGQEICAWASVWAALQ